MTQKRNYITHPLSSLEAINLIQKSRGYEEARLMHTLLSLDLQKFIKVNKRSKFLKTDIAQLFHKTKQAVHFLLKKYPKEQCFIEEIAASEEGFALPPFLQGSLASPSSLAASDDSSNSSQNYSVKKESSSHE